MAENRGFVRNERLYSSNFTLVNAAVTNIKLVNVSDFTLAKLVTLLRES